MSPKEEARELIDKFTQTIWESGNTVNKPVVIQCAIICVDKILNLRMVHAMGRNDDYSEAEFYGEVRKELEKQ